MLVASGTRKSILCKSDFCSIGNQSVIMLMGTVYAPAVLGCTIVLTIIDIFVVALRFLNRRKLRQKTQLDDWFICNALVCFLNLYALD